jgi:hypothetical protein
MGRAEPLSFAGNGSVALVEVNCARVRSAQPVFSEDRMTDFINAFSIGHLGRLRGATLSGDVENNQRIFEGVYFSWDEAQAKIDISAGDDAAAMLAVDVAVEGAPRWFSLNLELGQGVLTEGDTLGIVVEGQAGAEVDLPLFIRSGGPGKTHDTRFPDPLALGPETRLSVALLTLEEGNESCGEPLFHTLVIGLPAKSGTLVLRDMRVFRVPAEKGLRSRPATLASFP